MRQPLSTLVIVALLSAFPAAAQEPAPARGPLAGLEQRWLDFRELNDEIRMTRELGLPSGPLSRMPLDSLLARASQARAGLLEQVYLTDPAGLESADAQAFEVLLRELQNAPDPSATGATARALDRPRECHAGFIPSPETRDTLDALTDHVFACYGEAAQRVVVDADTLDRLTILGLLGRTEEPLRRERLFRALEPVWRTVNGNDSAASPYREIVRRRLIDWGVSQTPMEERARALGVEPDSLERWLEQVLMAWRATLPDTLFEPWDFYHYAGEASRLLSPLIPKDSLLPINHRFYRALGADPDLLRVRYEIDPRPGKYPVAFTDIIGRRPVRAWVSASYRIGGLDNLSELLHETGHAVHVSAIRTRPAYADWPDSDTFTEAIADLAAHEMYEPEWQQAFLGAASPLEASIRSKYGGVVLDIAWALFEIRGHRNPDLSPNQVWTQITHDFLRIRPHPEWSWWAMRGQLINGPGYMLNYAFGAILIADIRARLAEQRGAFSTGDREWYRWVSDRLLRFGLEKPSREVVGTFLTRGVRPEALLTDLGRATR
jgi:hypothetical protein